MPAGEPLVWLLPETAPFAVTPSCDATKVTLGYSPASEAVIATEERCFARPLPAECVELVRVSDGMITSVRLSLLSVDELVQRNRDYPSPRVPGTFRA